jgi:hypothetical protein
MADSQSCLKCHSCYICLGYHEGDAHNDASCKMLSCFHRYKANKKGKPDTVHRIDLPHLGHVNLGQLSRTCDQNREL